jgi:protein ImuA
MLRMHPPDDLSAARVRWRVGAAPSAPNPLDPEAPGALRLQVRAAKRRDGPPGEWLMELDDETGRLRVAPGLADHAPVRDAAYAAA